MIRRIVIASIYSIVTFCVISYISVMYSLLSNTLSSDALINKPVSNIGFPYKYYYQFWLNGSDSPNCGWNFNNFLIDLLLTSIVVFTLYFLLKKKKK